MKSKSQSYLWVRSVVFVKDFFWHFGATISEEHNDTVTVSAFAFRAIFSCVKLKEENIEQNHQNTKVLFVCNSA
jgi:hypothetical protein